MNLKKIAIIFMVIMLSSSLFASDYGTTGKIAGKIVDKTTNQPLMGVNVVLQGTSLGAATNAEGLYTIIQVPPGTYVMESSYMGYKKTSVENVKVQVDLTTRVEIEMEQTTLELDETITVVAERPLVVRDLTSTSHKATQEEIVDMPSVQDAQDVIATMPGVVGDGETISARGGRSGEIVYMIDGIPVNDPLYNEQTVSVNKYAIQEIELQTGGFNAEYGNVQSGIVNIVTRSGGRRLSGRVAYFTDDFGSGGFVSEQNPFDLDVENWFKPKGTGLNTWSFNTDRLEFNLGGPEILSNKVLPALGLNFLRGKVDFFMSANIASSDGYLPDGSQKRVNTYKIYPLEFDEFDNVSKYEFMLDDNNNPIPETADHLLYLPVFPGVFGSGGLFKWGGRSRNDYNFTFSSSIKLSDTKRISLNFLDSQFWRSGYYHPYKFVPTKNQLTLSNGKTFTLGWTHTISANSFYQTRFSLFSNRRESLPGLYNGAKNNPGLMNDELGRGNADTYGEYEGGPPDFIGRNEYGVDADGRIMSESFFTSFYKFHLLPPAVDGGGGWRGDSWQVNNTKTYLFKTDYLNQITPHHEIKTGIEVKYMDLRHARIYYSKGIMPTRTWENTEGPWPQHGSLRDFYTRYPNQGAYYFQDKVEYETLIVNMGLRFDWYSPGKQVVMPDGSGDNISVKKYLSPRLGVSHPITERAVVYFFYGRFLQFPDYNNLYRRQNRFRFWQAQLNLFGNPDLEAEETTSYEVGLDYQITEDFKIGVTGFYKDNKNLIDTEVRGTTADNWSILVNRDYGSDRGFEFELIKRYSHFISGRFNYTLGWATGKSSTFTQGYDSGLGGLVPLKEVYLNWDQRHTINGDIRFEIPRNRGPSLFGKRLDRWGVAFLFRYGSGTPYTPDIAGGVGYVEENSARRPYTMTLNVRFRKDFTVVRNYIGSAYLDVFNVFNKRNVRSVYADTGTPEGNRTPYEMNPTRLGAPRNIVMGFGIRF